jgi:uncharacterized low-complexity protein
MRQFGRDIAMNNKMIKPVSLAVGAAFVGGLALGNAAFAADGLQATDLAQGYMLVDDTKKPEEGKCGEGKCGEGKCGGEKAKEEGKCGEGKCGEGKCGGEKAKEEGKCGEGKCGGEKAKEEGRCGGAA